MILSYNGRAGVCRAALLTGVLLGVVGCSRSAPLPAVAAPQSKNLLTGVDTVNRWYMDVQPGSEAAQIGRAHV